MTVAEMIAQRTAKLTAIKDSSNAAVTAKGGTAAGDLSGLPAAIASIPSGGELPVLTNPAAAGDVIAGKEYIDGEGAKQAGTLVVFDTIEVVESSGEGGVGLQVNLESSADGSSKMLTIPEPNLLPENIKNGVSIFGIAGTAKTLRVETGTITPAEDINDIQIDCTPGYSLFVLLLSSGSPTTGNNHITQIYCTPEISPVAGIARNANLRYIKNSGENGYAITSAACDNGFALNINNYLAAGCTYTWTAYYWEDT